MYEYDYLMMHVCSEMPIGQVYYQDKTLRKRPVLKSNVDLMWIVNGLIMSRLNMMSDRLEHEFALQKCAASAYDSEADLDKINDLWRLTTNTREQYNISGNKTFQFAV